MTIYLDHAATSWPKPRRVIEAMGRFMQEHAANPGRGAHGMARRAGAVVHRARLRLAALIDAPNPDRICFGSGATDALNTLLHGLPLPRDARVLVTPMEHNAVLRPLAARAQRGELELGFIECDQHGRVDLGALEQRLIERSVALICVNHVSNVNGAVQPLAEICATAHRHGALVLADLAQSVGARPVSLSALNIDAAALPIHKGLLGPTGLGALYLRDGIELEPRRQGGTGGDARSPDMPSRWPTRHEAGTLNTVAIAGLEAALDGLTTEALCERQRRDRELTSRCLERLEEVSGLELFSAARDHQDSGPVVSFRLPWLEPQELAAVLDASFDIAVRAGLHCAPRAHDRLGTLPQGAVRASFGVGNSEACVDALSDALREIGRACER